ncbi:hypothetical protein ACU5AX_13785 [Sphingomonas sp. XXL09]|uniref:hypothetical protein n=1 Tax=Sphingomonas sp. XXL09 TaxID=3457787 RepID=UPI00406BA119
MRMRKAMTGAALAAAMLAAGCDRSGDGTSITINASDGNTVGAVDGRTGEVKLKLPGFTGQFKLPNLKVQPNNFDLNGVHLYPGSTVDAINVSGGDGAGKAGDADGGVQVRFTSPADAATVRDWFQQRLTGAGFTLHADGQGLSGTTDEKKPFRMEVNDAGRGRTQGTIVLGG